jgi:hypothetical protein
MRSRLRFIWHLLAAASLAAIAWLSVDPAYACPQTRYLYTYYSEAEKITVVGFGSTNCINGAWALCSGEQTAYYDIDPEDCGGCGPGC